MSTKKALPYVALIPILLLAACSFGPPPSCGDNLGGTADTTKFDQLFTSMQLVAEADGQPGPEGDNGALFGSGDALAIQADAKSKVELRVCIQPRGPGDIAFDSTQTVSAGPGTFPVGTFKAGSYVIRVIVEGVLVKNFPFEIK